MFKKKFIKQLEDGKIDWQESINEDEKENFEQDYEIVFKDGSGVTCKLSVGVTLETETISENFGLGTQYFDFESSTYELIEVYEIEFYNGSGETVTHDEEMELKLTEHIKQII